MKNRLSECKTRSEVCNKHFFLKIEGDWINFDKKFVEEQGKRLGEEDLGMEKELIAESDEIRTREELF